MDTKELIGTTLGTCTIERVIGRGGMGVVFQAQKSRPVRTVAVKVLIPSVDEGAEQQRIFLERFRREANTVAKLEHKNILPIYEYDEAEVDGQEVAYLVMPYIRGGTLRERIDEKKRNGTQFDLKQIASYINQVADALSYAHSQGVVHRDIKPGNLLFHQDGRLLLSDFGIVRLQAGASTALTTSGSFLGTAEYASPEQIGSGMVDFRSDIYSLGIILYELLTGSVPFTGSNAFAVLAKHLNDPVPSVSNARPDISPAIESVVKKALAKNPADRYQSATAMAADLWAAVSSSRGPQLRLGGDANNTDLTVPERRAQMPSPPGIAGSGAGSERAIPPTKPAGPVRPPGGASGEPWKPWQWHGPSQAHAQAQNPVGTPFVAPVGAPLVGAMPPRAAQPGIALMVKTYRQGRRVFYYGVLLIALLLQFLVFILLNATLQGAGESAAILGVLLGSGINLLTLAAIGFTGVTHHRSIRNFALRSLIAAIIASVLAGSFINFGVRTEETHPFLAYLVLLLSNLYAIRQLARVDAAGEQIEVAPVLWRPAIVGALTGLLPLTIILIFALTTPVLRLPASTPLLNLFSVLCVALIGAPTPGAMMAVWLSGRMSFPTLVRSSAIAGMLMFCGAFLLVFLWGVLLANHTPYFSHLSQTWIALLVIAGVLGLIGALRGMLDAWVYRRVTRR